MTIFEEASERENRQKDQGAIKLTRRRLFLSVCIHSGITYVYGKYMEYPPPPPPRAKPLLVLQHPRTMMVQNTQKGYIIMTIDRKIDKVGYLDQYLHFRGEAA